MSKKANMQRRLPVGEMPMRWRCLQGIMAREGMSGMLVYADQVKPEALYYVANYTLIGERAFCFLPPEGSPSLFISEEWDMERAAEESGLSSVKALGESYAKDIVADMKGCDGDIGVVGLPQMTKRDLSEIEGALGRKMVSANSVVEKAAIIKSPYELDLIREAANMADAGFMRAQEVARPGMKDYELVAEIEYAMRLLGSTDNYQMLVVGRNNSGMLLPFGKEIERGDLILLEITPSNGIFTYTAQLCRTLSVGEPDGIVKEKYALLERALEESLKVIRPGVRVSEVARIENEIIGAGGYAEYCRPPYMRSRGHSFGLGRIELEDEATLEFSEGMSLVVHPNQFIPETGYLALGESIIVTSNGYERLTKTSSRMYLCGEGQS